MDSTEILITLIRWSLHAWKRDFHPPRFTALPAAPISRPALEVPFVAALSLDDAGHPLRIKLTPVSGFTSKAIADWAKANLTPGCAVLSDGLACFAAVIKAGCLHQAIIVGDRKPKDVPKFLWVNTILGNLKTSLGGAYHAFDFAKYAARYLAAFTYRFQFNTLPKRLLVAAISIGPRSNA